MIRYPAPLRPGDRVGVTAPSSGVSARYQPRFDFCIEFLQQQGFDVVLGDCLDGSRYVSAPAAERAEELTSLLLDPAIRAVVPPWGGELAIDLLPHLDWALIGAAEPTWLVGYSDISTLLTPMTLLTGIATCHGNNLMDTPYYASGPFLSWLDVSALPKGSAFTQEPAPLYRAEGFDDWQANPTISDYTLDTPGTWIRLDSQDDTVASGRLIGGCIETLSNLSGTPYGNIAEFARQHAPEGLVIYLEAAEASSCDVARRLHGMKLAGWFSEATAVLIGRTRAPGVPDLSQHDAALDALGDLGIPIIADVECGHVPPYLPIVNGAHGTVTLTDEKKALTQTLT